MNYKYHFVTGKGSDTMPKSTFLNLPCEKKTKIETALFTIFYNTPLSQVTVSQIVSEINMSRGIFYKYFDDIEDAYTYIVQQATHQIHYDIIQYVQHTQYDLFEGLEQYLLFCTRLTPAQDYWKKLSIVTYADRTKNDLKIPKQQHQKLWKIWDYLLRKNQFCLNDPEEQKSFLYFLMDNMLRLLSYLIIYDRTQEEVQQEFYYFKKWVQLGISNC